MLLINERNRVYFYVQAEISLRLFDSGILMIILFKNSQIIIPQVIGKINPLQPWLVK